jgi:hypothetical protein
MTSDREFSHVAAESLILALPLGSGLRVCNRVEPLLFSTLLAFGICHEAGQYLTSMQIAIVRFYYLDE